MPSLSQSLPTIATVNELAEFLGISEFELKSFCLRPKRFYNTFERAKKSGKGTRKINAPCNKLKTVQKLIKAKILDYVDVHKSSTGYKRGGSIVDNAQVHVGKRALLNLDIENFFPSISMPRVTGLFSAMGFPEDVAIMLARLCCFEHALPQGAPTSPSLANIICHKLDRRLKGLAENRKMQYTRYCDDITLSSDENIAKGFVSFVKQIIAEEGFFVNEEKTRILTRRSCQIVTGLTVNQKVNVPRAKRRLVRAAFHKATKDSLVAEAERKRLEGFAAFMEMVKRCQLKTRKTPRLRQKRA